MPDLPEVLADFEQSDERPFYSHCSHICMYALAALEPKRAQVQVLHDRDPCCYSAQHLHEEIRAYNEFIHALPGLGGWMQTAVTAGEKCWGGVSRMLHIARHTSHFTRYTSHVTRTPHVTRQSSHVTGNIHQVNYRDRVIVAWLVERLR